MFKKTVKYKDFNGNQHTEDLYFHLSSPEMLDLQFNPQVDGDLDQFIKEGIRGGRGRELWIIFKLLIINSYGRRSEDGSQFRKKPEWTEEFLDSPQYEAFFEWLLLDSPDGKHGSEFYNGIMPERLQAEVAKLQQGEEGPDTRKPVTEYSRAELEAMLEKMKQPRNTQSIEGSVS